MSANKFLKDANKLVDRFCGQVAAWVTDVFCNFNLLKSHKIADNSATTEAREKVSTDLESLEFLKYVPLNLDTNLQLSCDQVRINHCYDFGHTMLYCLSLM
jgi:hypothetical protein